MTDQTKAAELPLMCSAEFIETASEIYAGGAEDNDGQFIPALIHDARQARQLASELTALRERLAAVELERRDARDLLTFEHTGNLGMKSLMQNEIDQLRTQLAACEAKVREVEAERDRLSQCLDRVRKTLEARDYASRLNQLEAIRDCIRIPLPDSEADKELLRLLESSEREVGELKAALTAANQAKAELDKLRSILRPALHGDSSKLQIKCTVEVGKELHKLVCCPSFTTNNERAE